MRLRRLLLLPSTETADLTGSSNTKTHTRDLTPDQTEPSDWDLLAELDRLRATNSGLTAEVSRQTNIGQDYARVASEQRLRVEELERENAIAHANAQMLGRRVGQAEERLAELEELVEALRSQRDRLQTYYDQQRERAERADGASAAIRDAAGDLLAASDLQSHAAVGTRGLARAKVEYSDAVDKLRRALERDAGKNFLAPEVVDQVRRFFTAEDLAMDEKKQLRQAIVRSLGAPPQ
jgi:hypothetical protein